MDSTERSAVRRARMLAIACLAAALALGLLRPVGGYDTAEADFYGAYAPQALRLLAGEPYTWSRSGPGYSVLLAAAGLCGLDLFVAAKILAAAGVALIGYATFLLSRVFMPAGPALIAQLAVYVALFRYGLQAGNDVPCAAFSLLSLLYLLRSPAPRMRDLLLAGICAGAAAATRYPALALAIVAVPTLVCHDWGLVPLARRLRQAGAYLAGFLLCSGPWWIWNAIANGSPLASKAYALVALDAFGGSGTKLSQAELAAMERRFGSLSEVLWHDPIRFLSHLPEDFYRDAVQLLADVVTLPCSLALGLGLLVLARGDAARRWQLLSLLAFALLAFAFVALAPYQSRYHLSIAPVLFLLAAAALVPGSLPGMELRGPRIAAAVWGSLAAAVLAGTSLLLTAKVLRDVPRELLPASRALLELGMPGDKIALRKPHLAFLAGLEPRYVGQAGGWAQFMDWFAEDPGTRFVYIGPRELGEMPELTAILRSGPAPDGFRLVHRSEMPAAVVLERLPR